MSVRHAVAGLGLPVRTGVRSVRLLAAVARAAAELMAGRRLPREVSRAGARRVLRAMGVQLQVCGEVPPSSLIVCNHLSYLDVVVISATAPAVFVAKSELRSWPVLGWIARRTGTIFAERGRSSSAGQTVAEIEGALRSGSRVVLFPEGTSSGGKTVLPFKSSLLEPGRGGPIWAAALAYSLEAGDGDPAEVVCYWKDMTFLPHLVRLLGRRSIRAKLVFARLDDSAADRKVLARRLHSLVLNLKPIADYNPQREGRRADPSHGQSEAKSTMTCGARLAGPALD